MNPITVKTAKGKDRLLHLRKVPLNLIGMLSGELADDEKALLCIAPEGRSPEEVREVFQKLDEESQFEVWAQGLELNEANLKRYADRKKKLAEASGLNIDKMVEKLVQKKMEESMGSLDLSPVVTATASSSPNTVPMNSSTSEKDTPE